jgi:hypothetical protein
VWRSNAVMCVTVWRSNAVMCVTVRYNKVLFSSLYFLSSQSEVDFGISHIYSDFTLVLCELKTMFITASQY